MAIVWTFFQLLVTDDVKINNVQYKESEHT